jgi:hypothetical protein
MSKTVCIIGKVQGEQYQDAFSKFSQREVALMEAGYKVVNPMRSVPVGSDPVETLRVFITDLMKCDAVSTLWDWKYGKWSNLLFWLAVRVNLTFISDMNLKNDEI